MSVINTELAIKQAITATNAPLLAGIPIFENYRESRDNGGFFPAPSGANLGGHAIAIVGWTRDNWIIKNSWGEGWGDGGYCYWRIDQSYHIYSLWSFVDASNPIIDQNKLIEANKKLVSSWALPSWEKAIDKNLIVGETTPQKVMTKEEFFVFLDRLNLI